MVGRCDTATAAAAAAAAKAAYTRGHHSTGASSGSNHRFADAMGSAAVALHSPSTRDIGLTSDIAAATNQRGGNRRPANTRGQKRAHERDDDEEDEEGEASDEEDAITAAGAASSPSTAPASILPHPSSSLSRAEVRRSRTLLYKPSAVASLGGGGKSSSMRFFCPFQCNPTPEFAISSRRTIKKHVMQCAYEDEELSRILHGMTFASEAQMYGEFLKQQPGKI